MEVYNLEDMAAFCLAKSLWQNNLNLGLEAVCKLSNDSINKVRNVWDTHTEDVRQFSTHVYPNLPFLIKNRIETAIDCIGKGLSMSLCYKQQLIAVLKDVHSEDIRWKADFSLDLVKSLCISKRFNVADEAFCECCLNRYVHACWLKLDFYEPTIIFDYFGKYQYHALAYYFCYVKKGFNFAWFVTLFHRFFAKDAIVENMFKFSTIIGYTEAAAHYLKHMDDTKKKENVKFVLGCFITENSFKCIRWNNVDMFIFLWKQLDYPEQSEIVSRHFISLYRYMVFHKLECLVSIIRSHASVIQNDERSHWILLDDLICRMSVKKIKMNSDSYYRELLFILWRNIAKSLPDRIVFNFLKLSLYYVDEPVFASMLLNVFDVEKKSKLYRTFREDFCDPSNVSVIDRLHSSHMFMYLNERLIS